MFPGPKELRLIGCSIESIWTQKIKSSASTPKNQHADMLTNGNFTRDEWNHLLCLFNFSHFLNPTKLDGSDNNRADRNNLRFAMGFILYKAGTKEVRSRDLRRCRLSLFLAHLNLCLGLRQGRNVFLRIVHDARQQAAQTFPNKILK